MIVILAKILIIETIKITVAMVAETLSCSPIYAQSLAKYLKDLIFVEGRERRKGKRKKEVREGREGKLPQR